MRAARDRLAGGAVHGNPARADQRVDAADVIAMMMRREDRGELDTLAREPFLYRRGVTRIDDRGAPADPYRAVRPGGQVVIAGFNPFSLFGARRYFGRGEMPPWTGNFIALYRLKDWLKLLGFEVSGGGLDCYVPPFTTEQWLRRSGFFESAGDRWWPIAGGVYFLRATKNVLGMRVITPAWQGKKRGLATAPRQARECIERAP